MVLDVQLDRAYMQLAGTDSLIGRPPSTITKKSDESYNQFMNRLCIDPVVDYTMFWANPEQNSTYERRYWTFNRGQRKYYVQKFALAVGIIVALNYIIVKMLLPETPITSNETMAKWYQKLTHSLLYEPPNNEGFNVGVGSFYQPINVRGLTADPTKPGLRSIAIADLQRLSNSKHLDLQIPVLNWIHDKFGIGTARQVEEENKLPDYVNSQYLYYNRNLNGRQAHAAMEHGTDDINHR